MIFLLVIVAVVAVVFVLIYNSLIAKKNQVENSFSGIDTLLKKRYDLIPNLVATVQQYSNYEKSTLTQITELRAKAVSGNISSDEKVELDNQLSRSLKGIFVTAENYPDLKANSSFMDLQKNLSDLEDQISSSRRAYNNSVMDFNNAIEMFPSSFVAGLMGLQRKKLFEVLETERQNVNVKELFSK